MQPPKLLIIANQCLSCQTSNGRTLRNFLIGWPKERIAQFCTQLINPDFELCDNYYCVTDKQALNSFFGKKNIGGTIIQKTVQEKKKEKAIKRLSKNPLTMLLRNFIWNRQFWMSKEFNQWTDNFNPDIILLQAGDSPFMFKLARILSKKYYCPLYLYNSEGYYFKNYDYFKSKGIPHILYPLFHYLLRYEFKQTLKKTKQSIYICDELKKAYDETFNLPSTAIYTSTEIIYQECQQNQGEIQISYLGNLGVGRHKVLIEIANVLQSINSSFHLNVYGNMPNENIKKDFETCSGIIYKGFLSYNEVVKVMHTSNLLIHCESFDKFYQEDSKYAFSTKISDSLACGTPLLLYAPKQMAIYKYLKENNAAFVAENTNDLKKILKNFISVPEERNIHISNALDLVKKNHNAIKNSIQFQNILMGS